VQVLSGGQLVGEAANSGPPIIIETESICPPECLIAINPSGCGKGVAELQGLRTACGRWSWPKLIKFSLPDGRVFEGDEIRILAEDATDPFDYVSRIDLLASGLDTISIGSETSEQVSGTNPCIGDFNGDGGIDGADVDAFFAAWSAGQAGADVNRDGGVDGSDVDAFFAAWVEGRC